MPRAPIESNRFELYKSSIRPEGSNLYKSSIRSELANCSTNTNICRTPVTYITCATWKLKLFLNSNKKKTNKFFLYLINTLKIYIC
jgi:hypothetical protein